MSDLHQRFTAHAGAWEAHCRAVSTSSAPRDYVVHPDFAAIVAMGAAVVPFVVERYRTGPLFWGAVLAQITGDASRGDGVSGDLKATKRAWLAWWDAQASS